MMQFYVWLNEKKIKKIYVVCCFFHVDIHVSLLTPQTPISDGEWLFYLHEGVFPTAKDEEAEEGGVV